jgi:hypothetical protein
LIVAADSYALALLRERDSYLRDPRRGHRVADVDLELAQLGLAVEDGALVPLPPVEKATPRERAVRRAPERAVDKG